MATDLRYESIVIGLGGVGSAALWHLANQGITCLGIDRFRPPHSHGSSHGHTRVIRQAYFEHPDYVPLALASYELWHALESQAQQQLLFETGILQIGPRDGEVVSGLITASQRHNLTLDELTPAEIKTRCGPFQVAADQVGLYEERGGYLLVEDCIRAHLGAAEQAGAQTITNGAVYDWRQTDDGLFLVETNEHRLTCEKLILAPGTAAAKLCRLDIDFEVRQKEVFWFATSHQKLRDVPIFLQECADREVYYGFPAMNGRIKIARHTGGEAFGGDALGCRTSSPQKDLPGVRGFARDLLGMDCDIIADSQICWYTMSPDGHFCVGAHPKYPHVYLACGLSGHGFKFTSALGKALADAVVTNQIPSEIGFLAPTRFATS